MIEIRIYDETDDYLFDIYRTYNAGDALVWLRDEINALQRPVKIRIYYPSCEQKEKSSCYPNADVDGMITYADEPKYSG